MNKEKLLAMVVGMVVERLSEAQIKEFADMALDFVEDKVVASTTPYDDLVILPMCKLVREAFDIPDND